MAKNQIPEIELSADELKRLQQRLDDYINVAEEFKTSKWDELHKMYWQIYFAEPDHPIKDYPFPNASNLFMPLGHVLVEGNMAQEYDAMFTAEPTVKVVAFKGVGATQAESNTLSQFYGEYVYREVINLKTIANDWLLDNTVDGTSAAKPRWERDRIVKRLQSVVNEPIMKEIKDTVYGAPIKAEIPIGMESHIHEDAIIERIEKPVVDIMDMAHIFVAPGSGPSLQWPECPWYYQQQYLTWDALATRRRDAGYKNIDDELKKRLTQAPVTPKDELSRKREAVSENLTQNTLRVLEFYLRWPLPGRYIMFDGADIEEDFDQKEGEDGYAEEIIVTYAPEIKKVFNIRPLSRVYPDGKRPGVDMRYKRIPRFFYGYGIPSMVRHINAAVNSSWNQYTDFGHLVNNPWGLYEPSTVGPLPDIVGVRPGSLIPVNNASGVVFPRMQFDPAFFIGAQQQLQAWGEKVGAYSDYNAGRAPNIPNAPRTASGQAQMLQQSMTVFNRLVALHAESVLELFRRVHSLYKRYSPPQQVFRIFNQQAGSLERKTMTREEFDGDVDFQFVLNPNRQAEQQLNMAIVQTLTPILMQVNPEGLRPLHKEWYNSMGKKGFEELWPESMPPQVQSDQQMPMPQMSGPADLNQQLAQTLPPSPPPEAENDVDFPEGSTDNEIEDNEVNR